jgi:hypothetical protein
VLTKLDFVRIKPICFKIVETAVVIYGLILIVTGFITPSEGGFLTYFFHGLFWLALGGWSLVLFRLSQSRSKFLGITVGVIGSLTGLALLGTGLLRENPLAQSAGSLLHFLLGTLLGIVIGLGFLLLGIAILLAAASPSPKDPAR